MRAYRLRDPNDNNTHRNSCYKIRLIEWNMLYVINPYPANVENMVSS